MSNERERIDLAAFDGHTPGPWEVTDAEEFTRPDQPADYRVCAIGEDGSCVCCVALMGEYDHDTKEWKDTTLAEWRANATVIAAAPTLLAEVRALREERDALRAVLKPFVDAQGYWGDGLENVEPAGWFDAGGHLPLSVGNMRRARKALTAPTKANEPSAPDQRVGTTENA